MSEHTPGPWRIGGTKDLKHGRGREIAADAARIGIVYGVIDPDVIANARLIAAAPELLEACRDAASKIDDCLDGKINFRSDFADRLKAAIAKAEGE